ncbi:MAG: hypothetical protein ACHQWU_04950 [Gemmatimonadales bacterium]
MSATMQGVRVRGYDGSWLLEPGEYARHPVDGIWYANAPNGLLANLGNHDVTEHEDGTITVSPSILVSRGDDGPRWHGFLERGVWREC